MVKREREQPVKWLPVALANAVQRRIAAGQDASQAIDEVLEFYRAKTVELLNQRAVEAEEKAAAKAAQADQQPQPQAE